MVQYRYNIFHVARALTPPIGKGFAPPRGAFPLRLDYYFWTKHLASAPAPPNHCLCR